MKTEPMAQRCRVLLLGLLIAGPSVAAAEDAPPRGEKGALPSSKKGKDTRAALDPADELLGELRGGEVQAVEAAQKLAALSTPRALEIMLNELSVGVPPKVAAALLDGVAARKEARAMDVLGLYVQNRNPDLRRRAIAALGEIAEPATTPALLAALSDPAADVRAAAARALGARRERSAEPLLIKLLARKDTAAPQALGQIGGAETARALGEMVGNVPDRLVVQTLGELLKRPDFGPDPLRVEVIRTLGKIPGPDALDVLSDYVKASARDKARPSRTEASKIIEQRTAK